MAEFLTTNGTSYHIENIIIGAKKTLNLVSPYLQLSKTFHERLKDASNRNVNIKIVYGKDELKPNEKNSLAELNNIELFYFENLHAKCYFNESEMVITSMNMYEFSEKNNREMGVYITLKNDMELYNKAVSETMSILQSSEKIPLVKTKRNVVEWNINDEEKQKKVTNMSRGYCIRCSKRISFDFNKPYCKDCYSSWSNWENYEYEEEVCHSCGEYVNTSMAKPLCRSCYKQL